MIDGGSMHYGLKPIIESNLDYYKINFRLNEGLNEGLKKDLQKDILKLGENFSVSFSVKGNQLDWRVLVIVNIAEGKALNLLAISKEFNVSLRTVYEDIKKLRNWGVVKFEGSPKTGKYILTDKGEKLVEEVIKK